MCINVYSALRKFHLHNFTILGQSAPILTQDMVVIADIVRVVGVEGLVADVAVGLLVGVEDKPIVPLPALLIDGETNRNPSRLLRNEPFDANLPQLALVPLVEVGNVETM